MALKAECPACHGTINRMAVTPVVVAGSRNYQYKCPLCRVYYFFDGDGALSEDAIRDRLRRDFWKDLSSQSPR
jgi:hypothetical protein